MPRCRTLSQPHDPDLSRMLVVYIATGVAFMLLPGTFVGVMSLLKISSHHAASAAGSAWVQAHGHAQIFGWLGTFILGIGYYTIPRLRLSPYHAAAAWTTYGLWTAGVTVRWAVGSWPWHWRVLFPLAGALELLAVLIFAVSVFVMRPRSHDDAWRKSVLMITGAGVGFVVSLIANLWQSVIVARTASEPLFPEPFNGRFLALITWGFIVPFIWGFSSRWIGPLLGLRPTRKALMMPSMAILTAGVVLAMSGAPLAASVLFAVATLLFAGVAMRVFEPPAKEAKLRGVHVWTPSFIRLAYAWSVVAALLAIAAAMHGGSRGYAGAGRHALTVGFFTAMVFAIGPRVLPAFFNVRALFSTRLMGIALVLLNVGCTMRVVSQVLAYEGLAQWAWITLPASAIVEMVAVTVFAVNMLLTLRMGSPLEALNEGKFATA